MLKQLKYRKQHCMMFIILCLFEIIEVSTNYVKPTQTIQDWYCFGAHNLKFSSLNDNNNLDFTNMTAYTFNRPLNKTYFNVSNVNAFITTFQSNVDNYIGFQIHAQFQVNSSNIVTISLNIKENSSFVSIGFSVFIITNPFSEIISLIDIQINAQNSSVVINHNLKQTYEAYLLINSLDILAQNQQSINPTFEVDLLANTISFFCAQLANISTDYNYSIKLIWVYLDLQLKQQNALFSLLAINQYHSIDPFGMGIINFNINTTEYGMDFQHKCIFGFSHFRVVNAQNLIFDYDLDHDAGILNGRSNPTSNGYKISPICMQSYKCPDDFPFQQANMSFECHDCTDGLQSTQLQIQNCYALDNSYTKIQYNQTSGQILQRCIKCVQCSQNFFLLNSTCIACQMIIPNCSICNISLQQCLTCSQTYFLDQTTQECVLCQQRIINCKYCESQDLCETCMAGFQFFDGICQRPLGFYTLNKLMDYTINNVVYVWCNQIPNSRKFFRLFYGFVANFDDMLYYMFHDRHYDLVTETVFTNNLQMINQQWLFVPYHQFYEQHFNVNTTYVDQILDNKIDFTGAGYLNEVEQGQSFFLNTTDFFLANLILMILAFIIAKIIYFILRKHVVSLLLRQYSFLITLILVVNDGNIQFFTFLFGFELQTLFYYGEKDKIMAIFVLLLFFYLIFTVIAVYFLIFQFNTKKQARYMFDNVFVTPYTCLFMSVQFGVRNLLLGLCHAFNDDSYRYKIGSILVVEIIFLFINILFSSKTLWKKSLLLKFNHWVSNVAGPFLRIVLISTFLIETNTPADQQSQQANLSYFSNLYIYIFISTYSLTLICFFYQLIYSSIQAVSFLLIYRKKAVTRQQIQKLLQKQTSIPKLIINIFQHIQSQKRLSIKLLSIKLSKFQIEQTQENIFDSLQKKHKPIRVSKMDNNRRIAIKSRQVTQITWDQQDNKLEGGQGLRSIFQADQHHYQGL